jgi:hypothetical protein
MVTLLLVPAISSAQAGDVDTDAVVEEDGWDADTEDEEEFSGQDADGEWDAEVDGDWDLDAGGDAGGDAGEDDFSMSEWIGDHLTWSGYYENQLMIFALPRHTSDPDGWGVDLMDYNKVRLDLAATPIPGFSANADVVIRTYHGTSKYVLKDMLPPKFDAELDALALVDPSMVIYRLENEVYLDNAYLTANFWRLRLRVGKQQLRFGSGYMWNPTDPFNKIDMLDPSYEKVGVTAARLELFLPHEGLIELFAVPRSMLDDFHLEDTGLAFRGRIAFDRWVIAVVYAYYRDIAGYDVNTIEPVEGRRHLIGLEVTGEIGGVGLWAEAAYNMMAREDWDRLFDVGRGHWFEVLGGINYTFRCGVMVMGEYLYNSRGRNNSATYSLLDWFSWLDQTVKYMGQHYVTATIQVPVSRIHTTFSVTGIVNASDHSFVINPWISYEWNQYLSVSLYGAFTGGDSRTDEFSANGHAGYVRFRFSF